MGIKKYLLFFLVIFFACSINVSASKKLDSFYYDEYEYVIESYDVDIKVNENNTLDITETIETYFNVYKHGIFRTIPLTNEVTRLDGTINKNRAQISNVSVSDNYTTYKEDGNFVIKIGDANTTLIGKKLYTISYTYNIGKDYSKNYDELYFNIIGNEWDTVINNVTFTITLPKEFDKNKLGFSAGYLGSIDSNNVSYKVNGNVINGKYSGVLTPGEGLTVRIELPEGYFVNAGYQIDMFTVLFFLIPIISLLTALVLWYKYGKDDMVVETVEFYPPDGFNSLEIAYLYKGEVDNEDVTSLLIYLANQGYLKIVEPEKKKLFSSSHFEIVKLKDYDGENYNEKLFFDGLFRSKTIVTQSDLYDRFYRTMNRILSNVNTKDNKKKIFESAASSKSLLLVLFIILSLLVIIIIPTVQYAGMNEVLMTLFITLFYLPFYAVGLSKIMPKAMKVFWLGFTIFHSLAFFSTTPLVSALMAEPLLLRGFILGIFCIVGIIICFKSMPKRTKYGSEMLGRIKGFKKFLETAEKERLEAMVLQDPKYFYNILPFTYVLGISDKWIKQFETISMQSPDWYDSPSSFELRSFGNFMNSTMTSAKSAMITSPSSSSGSSGSSFSGGGSSGGGSSGGGSGGGGGGSW